MRRTLVALTALVGAGAALTGLTLASASASPAAVPVEHFRIISTAATSTRLSTLATGDFTAGGYEVPGNVVSGYATDKTVLSGGTFRVRRHVTSETLPVPAGCLFSESQRGTYSLSHGTGAYRGISGSGTFNITITAIYARLASGGCGTRFAVFQQLTYEGGTVRR
jgi:hypothetical protein